MSTRILYDSVSEVAFGPLFHGNSSESAADLAEEFVQWLIGRAARKDPRAYGHVELVDVIAMWRHERGEMHAEETTTR